LKNLDGEKLAEKIELDFSKLGGLIPAIAQDWKTKEVLMLAFMNKEAFEKTLKEGKAFYYSRSRQKLWMKGEESGNIQIVKEILIDCDNDCVLLKVEQVGKAACHTGFESCFFRRIEKGKIKETGRKIFDPEKVYGKKK